MGYVAIETALQTVLQELTGSFATPEQVTRADWTVLDKGFDACVIFYPGPYQETGFGANNTLDVVWTVHMQLHLRITGTFADAVIAFATLRDAVREQIQAHPTLGITGVLTTLGTAGDEPIAIGDTAESGPFGLMETIDLQVQEEISVEIEG